MKVNKIYLKYLFLMIPFLLSPVIFTVTNKYFAMILVVCKLLSFVYIFTAHVCRGRVSKLDIAIFLYIAVWLISAIFNRQDIFSIFKEIVVILAMLFICGEAYTEKKEMYLCKAMSHVLVVELILNFISYIIFPNGMYTTVSIYGSSAKYAFLGLDNQITPIIITSIMLFILLSSRKENTSKVFIIVFFIAIIANVVNMSSGTNIAAIFIICISFLIMKKKEGILNYKRIMIIVTIIFLMFVVFRVQNLFAFFINGVLNKDLTFTNRTKIWDSAMRLISKKKWIGYGCETMATIIVDRNAHDFYLQILLQSGVFGFILYLNIFRKTILNKIKKNDFIAPCLLAYMVASIFEVYSQMWLVIILATIYYGVGKRADKEKGV